MIRRNSFVSGVEHSYPVCLAFLFMFSALGILGHANGFNLLKMVSMSAIIFAVPLQALVINSYDLPILALAANAFVLNFKFLLMAATLIPLWRKRKMNIPSLHFICSSTYMVCLVEKDVEDPWLFYLGVAIPSYFTAILATALGYGLWQLNPNYQTFLHALAHIILPVHFICLTMKRRKEITPIIATCLGLMMTPVLSKFFSTPILILLWVLIAGILVSLEGVVCGKQSLQQA